MGFDLMPDLTLLQLSFTDRLVCRHHWKVASAEDWCDCDGTRHVHAWCRECAAERTFPSYIETGPIAKAAVYAKRGGKAKWKGASVT